jgi:integrase/recombinase XerD
MSARTPVPWFQGILAEAFEAFLAYRRGLGTCHEHLGVGLRHLDRFLVREAPRARGLDHALLDRWLATLANRNPATRRNYFRIARQLCLFLSRSDPTAYVPEAARAPRAGPLFHPYLYSTAEVRALLTAARHLPGDLRPHTYSTLLLLLYTTGLRLGEAVRLVLGDLDREAGVLHIRPGKFGKARLVPLAPGVLARVVDYLDRRRRAGAPTGPAAPLLWHPGGGYSLRGLQSGVAGLLTTVCGKRPGRGGPRVHDLRHAFARHRLWQWYQAGADVQAKLPLLATYLGHRSFLSTQVYLTATPELLAEASGRFHARFGDVLPTPEVSDAQHP